MSPTVPKTRTTGILAGCPFSIRSITLMTASSSTMRIFVRFPAYKAYLEKVFTNMPEEPIKIKDVSVTENGSLRVDVTDESLPYVGVQWRPL